MTDCSWQKITNTCFAGGLKCASREAYGLSGSIFGRMGDLPVKLVGRGRQTAR